MRLPTNGICQSKSTNPANPKTKLLPRELKNSVRQSWARNQKSPIFHSLYEFVETISASEATSDVDQRATLAEERALSLPEMDEDIAEAPDDPSEYPFSINDRLYETLRQHIPCTCGQLSGGRPTATTHLPQMCLQAQNLDSTGQNVNLEFQMMISQDHFSQSTPAREWRGVVFSTPRWAIEYLFCSKITLWVNIILVQER